MDGAGRRQRANNRLDGVPKEGGIRRRVRQRDARGQVVDQDSVRAENQMSEGRDAVLRGEQDNDRPMVKLVSMAEAQRLKARRAVGRERDRWR